MDDTLRQACNQIFVYPPSPPPRRHGPRGYAEYQFYKPWLRDEYAFCCLYCLWRERWQADGHGGFGGEHVQPQGAEPSLRLDYENLVYSCNMCNSTRREVPLPFNPASEPPGRHLRIAADGTAQGITHEGAELIELCRLNRPLLVAARRRMINLIALLRTVDSPEAIEALRDLMALPSDLPDLAVLHPPGGNARPNGIADSFLERQRRGEIGDLQ
jgi:hypothetical protein